MAVNTNEDEVVVFQETTQTFRRIILSPPSTLKMESGPLIRRYVPTTLYGVTRQEAIILIKTEIKTSKHVATNVDRFIL
jgi:hypothetical protein